MQALLDWLIGIPSGTLYAVLAGVAALENFVPPFPADVAVAFGSFLAAQGQHRMLSVFLAAWLGNVAGALAVYELSRKYGAERLERRIAGAKAPQRQAAFQSLFARYGYAALFLARFIPGVRALVPAAAGALRLPRLHTGLMLTSAAALWYGFITFVAYRVGSDWERLKAVMTDYGAAFGVAALVLLVLGLTVWAIARRRQRP